MCLVPQMYPSGSLETVFTGQWLHTQMCFMYLSLHYGSCELSLRPSICFGYQYTHIFTQMLKGILSETRNGLLYIVLVDLVVGNC